MKDTTFPPTFEPRIVSKTIAESVAHLASTATTGEPFEHAGQFYAKDRDGNVRHALPPEQFAAYRAACTAERRSEIAREIDACVRKAGVPDRFTGASLDSLGDVAGGYRATASKLRKLVTAPGMFALCGTRGGGKTHLSAAIVRLFVEEARTARYARVMELILAIRSSFRNEGPTQETIINQLASVDLLVIDELQVRADTPFEDTFLTDLIDRRYAAMKSTILICNLTPAAFCERIGDSVVSRLTETGGLVECKWPSRREATRRAG